MQPRTIIEGIEQNSLVPAGECDRFAGYAVIGLPFVSGHVLALRRFPASSLGPGYTSVWHRDPGGTWTFYSTVAPEQSCSRYFGSEIEHNVHAPIQIVWTAADTLRVVAECSRPIAWEITVGETTASRLMNFVARQLPDSLWQSRFMLHVMGVAARVLLGTGKMNLAGRTPNGQEFIANPKQVWVVKSSRAVVSGVDLGPAGPLASQARLNDFLLPQKGLFAVASAFLQSPTSLSHAVMRRAGAHFGPLQK
ncbi:MAG TPA: hypothetical protein VFU86_05365 [Terriglobales bacterium]|nr:hypothetical protein [Terriglobales bacterium]